MGTVTSERTRTSPAAKPSPHLSRRGIFLILALLLAAAAGTAALSRAWRETTLREAYLPELEARARRFPGDARLLAVLGARLARAGEYGSAARALGRAVSAGADDAPVWLAWSASAAAAGDRPGAEAVLRLGARRKPQIAPRLQAALERCRELDASAPPAALAEAISPEEDRLLLQTYGGGSVLNGLAEWWGRRHPETSGFATRERWASEEPRNVRAQLLWGKALMTNRRLSEAAAVLRQAVALAPESPDAHLALADVLLRGGAPGEAEREYAACLRLRPDWPPALIGSGNAALERKLLTVALKIFERATRLAPKSPDAWIGLGRSYGQIPSRRASSLHAFETAARLAPERTDYFFYYADALRINVHLDTAEAVLRRRLAEEPDDIRCLYLLSHVLTENKPSPERAREAEAVLRAALPLAAEPDLFAARLGQLLMNRGAAEETIRLLEPLFGASSRPSHYGSTAMMLLARAYRKTGDPDRARTAQERSLALSRYTARLSDLAEQARRDPYNPNIHGALADLLKSGGDMDKARKHSRIAAALREAAKNKPAERGGNVPDPENKSE
jgi:tetratricopeptide (TPR) repeat protein